MRLEDVLLVVFLGMALVGIYLGFKMEMQTDKNLYKRYEQCTAYPVSYQDFYALSKDIKVLLINSNCIGE